jgi:putative hydrolase of HD superfamily
MTRQEIFIFTNLFYEAGSLRKIMRAHQQKFLTTDPTDTIAAHSYRTTFIGLILALRCQESVDILKIVIMCLLHDFPEARTNDHHWGQKRYVRLYDLEALKDQLSELPLDFSLWDIMNEYEQRKSLESKIAKDADLLDQLLLMREYEWQGNKQATQWLQGNNGTTENEKLLSTETGKEFAREIKKQDPNEWSKGLGTPKCR